MQGASAIQSVLQDHPNAQIRVFAVWEPVLFTDWTAPSAAVLARLHDRRASQYWDRQLLLSQKIREAVGSDPAHGFAGVAERGKTVWDVVAIYPKGTRWGASVPSPTFADRPVVYAIEEFRRQLEGALAP